MISLNREAFVANSKLTAWAERNKLVLDRSKCTSAGATVKQCIILVNHWCHRILLTVAQISLCIMLLTVFMNVVLRFCFNSGITWAEEVPRLLVVLFSFLACAIGCRDHMHISVGILYNRFNPDTKLGHGVRKFMDVLADVAVLLCGIGIFYYGLMFTLRISRMPGTLPMTGWPTWLQYLPAPLCGFLMTFDQILFLTGIVDPKDLLYSEEEVDYAKLVKENEEVEGGKA